MSVRYEAAARCENGHETLVAVTPLAFNSDGVMTQGLMGSSADFCDVCDGAVIEIDTPKKKSHLRVVS